MKVVCLYGSPRLEGSSATIANHFLECAGSHGATVQTFALHRLDYCGCTSCSACKKQLDRCIINDGLAAVLDALYEAEVVVMATPIYFDGVNSKIIAFMERACSYFKADWVESQEDCRLTWGKKLVFIITQGQPENVGRDIFGRFEEVLEQLGFKERHLIRACGVNEPEDIQRREDVLELTEEIARKTFM